jgi:hypothetical protein
MKKIIVSIDYSGSNYAACAGDASIGGSILATGATLTEVRANWDEAFKFHVQGLEPALDYDAAALSAISDGYQVEYSLTAAALLRHCTDGKTTLTAIGKASGINMRQLSAYVQNRKKPRPAQYKRIVAGIQSIAKELSTCCCT